MYKSARVAKSQIFDLIGQGQLDLALISIHDFVERIFTEPLCTSQIFGSKELDYLCQLIGCSSLALVRQDQVLTSPCVRDFPIYVYVVTRVQNSGGHTKVIEDLIKARPNAQHFILATEICGGSDVFQVQRNQAVDIPVFLELAPNGRFLDKLIWLQRRLLQLAPDNTYLFNHHQDSVAVAAIQPNMLPKATFYHHGDHHICLGVFLTHLEHIDPHPMGYANCREILGVDNTYIPLVVDDHGCRAIELPFLQGNILTTCTAARSNKVEIPYFVSYLDVVPDLLAATGGRHVHIGRLTPWAIFKIRQGLKRKKLPSKSFVYIPWVSSVWQTLHEYQVDLYIASFPYGGGLTLIEAMGAGVPVALHRHISSRILSGIDLGYPQAFNWHAPEELIDYCMGLNPQSLAESGLLSRQHYESFHSRDMLEAALHGEKITPLHRGEAFYVDTDEWALWMERQVSLKIVFNKLLYRLFRRARSWLYLVFRYK